MNTVSLIARKRDGQPLSADEIGHLVRGYTEGSIPDYQMSALAMAIYLRGMSSEETTALTMSMLRSGTTLNWLASDAPRVDKHSTGGIGDKVSLILAPLVACCGLWVPMLSGRGLGPTGGTLDKLEAIPGFRTDLSLSQLQQIVREVGCVITGTSPELVPADQKLYALRDVTATVASIPLITASIMSKKLAEGLNALVLDVKYGSGAFMKTADQARQLADSLVAVGRHIGVPTTAILNDMNQPLGRMVGNALEVNESMAILRNAGPTDLRETTLQLASELLLSTGHSSTPTEARTELERLLAEGQAYEKFCQMVRAQCGDLNQPRPIAPAIDIEAPRAGHIAAIDAEKLGYAVIAMGGGRRVKEDKIDPSVGFEMRVRIGDSVSARQPLATLFCPHDKRDEATRLVLAAITLADNGHPSVFANETP